MMRLIPAHRAAVAAGAVIALFVCGETPAKAFGIGGRFGGHFGAPWLGPVGAGAFHGPGNWGRHHPHGFWGGGGFIGGWGGGGGGCCGGDNSTTINNVIVQPPPPKRNDGGYYGGGGVFYPDDGYSRINAVRPRGRYDDVGAPDYLPAQAGEPLRRVIYLPPSGERTPAQTDRRPRASRRNQTEY